MVRALDVYCQFKRALHASAVPYAFNGRSVWHLGWLAFFIGAAPSGAEGVGVID